MKLKLITKYSCYVANIFIIIAILLGLLALFHINDLRIFDSQNTDIDIVLDYENLADFSDDELTDIYNNYISGVVFSEIILNDFVQNGTVSVYSGREIIDAFRKQQIINIYMWKHIKDKDIKPDYHYVFINEENIFKTVYDYLKTEFQENLQIYSDEYYRFDGLIVNNFIIEISSQISFEEILNTPIGFHEMDIEKFRQLGFKIFFASNNLEYIHNKFYDKKIYLVDQYFSTETFFKTSTESDKDQTQKDLNISEETQNASVEKNNIIEINEASTTEYSNLYHSIKNYIAVQNFEQYNQHYLKYVIYENIHNIDFKDKSQIHYIKNDDIKSVLSKINKVIDKSSYELNREHFYTLYRSKTDTLINVYFVFSFIFVIYLILSNLKDYIKIILFSIIYLFSILYLRKIQLIYIYNIIITQIFVLFNIKNNNKIQEKKLKNIFIINIKNYVFTFLLIAGNYIFYKIITCTSNDYYFNIINNVILEHSNNLLMMTAFTAYAIYFFNKYSINDRIYLSPIDLFNTINFGIILFINYNIINTYYSTQLIIPFAFILFLSIDYYFRYINKSLEFLMYILSILFFVNVNILFPNLRTDSLIQNNLPLLLFIIPLSLTFSFIYKIILSKTKKTQEIF